VTTRLIAGFTDRIPLSHIWSAVLLLLADCGLAVLIPWLLVGSAVPARALAAGGVIFGLAMLVIRPMGSVYLPRALETSAQRYGTIGVAFTYIGWLYVLAFCLLMTAILGHVVAQDEGLLGRVIRGDAGQSYGEGDAAAPAGGAASPDGGGRRRPPAAPATPRRKGR
jgi:membrane protein